MRVTLRVFEVRKDIRRDEKNSVTCEANASTRSASGYVEIRYANLLRVENFSEEVYKWIREKISNPA